MHKGVNVRFDREEVEELRRAVSGRRDALEKLRKKMEQEGVATFPAEGQMEVLDRIRVALGDEPEDLWSGQHEPEEDGS